MAQVMKERRAVVKVSTPVRTTGSLRSPGSSMVSPASRCQPLEIPLWPYTVRGPYSNEWPPSLSWALLIGHWPHCKYKFKDTWFLCTANYCCFHWMMVNGKLIEFNEELAAKTINNKNIWVSIIYSFFRRTHNFSYYSSQSLKWKWIKVKCTQFVYWAYIFKYIPMAYFGSNLPTFVNCQIIIELNAFWAS